MQMDSLALEDDFRGYALEGVLTDVKVFVNPMMKSAVIGFVLDYDANIKIQVVSVRSKKVVREFFYVLGNPGGKSGDNKVIWKGTFENGLKVPPGHYCIRFFVNAKVLDQQEVFRF